MDKAINRKEALIQANAETERLTAERDTARAEVERLRDTLLFYADPKHYSYPTSPGGWTAYCGIVPADGGQKARAALAEQGEDADAPTVPPRVYSSDAPIVSRQKRPDLVLDEAER